MRGQVLAIFSSVNARLGKYIDTVDNVVELRRYSTDCLKSGDAVLLKSKVTLGDSGGAAMIWSPSATNTDDGTIYIKPDDATTGRWVKAFGQGAPGPKGDSLLGPKGDAGDRGDVGRPGGNIMAVGTFKELRSAGESGAYIVIPSGTRRVDTSGWNASGNGAASYFRNDTLTDANLTAHPRATFKTKDENGNIVRWMIDVSKEWAYEAFGALPYTGNQATQFDCSDAFDAIQGLNKFIRNATTGYISGRKITYGSAEYFHTRPQNNQALWNHSGSGAGSSGGSWNTGLVFAANTMGAVINAHNTNYDQLTAGDFSSAASTGTTYENLTIRSLGGSDMTKHGVWARDRVNLLNMKVVGFPGDNIHIVGHSNRQTVGLNLDGGNVNDWQINRVVVQGSGRHGAYFEGFDGNAGHSVSLEVLSAGCGGLVDNSFLGNTHTAPAIHGCGLAGNGRCSYNGHNYYLISANNDIGGQTTPGTNDGIWYDVGEGTSFPAWVSGKQYIYSSGLYTQGSVSRTIITGGYLEVGAVGVCHCPTPAIVMLGEGTTEFTEGSNVVSATIAGGMTSKNGVGGFKYSRGPTEQAGWGNYFSAAFGSEMQRVNGTFMNVSGQNSFPYRAKFLPNARGVWHDYANLVPMMWNMMNGVAETYGRTNPITSNNQPKTAFPNGILLNYSTAIGRVISSGTDVPDGNLDTAAGEFVFTSKPQTYGAIGFSCVSPTVFSGTTVTTPAVWAKAGPLFLTGEVIAALGDVAVGACSPVFTITVPGAKTSNAVVVSMERGTKGLQMVGWVDADNTVKFYASNPTGSSLGTVNLPNQYCYVRIYK
jgi:hypothetical protein